jgi:hypothetical protein
VLQRPKLFRQAPTDQTLVAPGRRLLRGRAWTDAHDAWLRRERFHSPALQVTFESDYDAVLTVKARRDRLDEAIAVMAAE